MDYTSLTYDYIIVGSGIAGLSTAYYLSNYSDNILVISKGEIREGSTELAQGGIAAALTKEDTPLHHLNDTIEAGDGLCDKEAVDVLVTEGPARVLDLINLGADFDKNGNELHFTREGAHSVRRILHARDATGREIEKTLRSRLLERKTVTFLPRTTVVDLIVEENECRGCIINTASKIQLLLAKAVVLATGGCGQIYSCTTNPPMITGDGIALAFNSGAAVQDMEFIQFHPTTLYSGDKKTISIFLISEAVRGEGAILRNALGKRFMPEYHDLAELAPRDVVSRAIYNEMQRTDKPHVYLDLGAIDLDIPARFPTIYERCRSAGIDITKDFIPVAPAAHYCMGGIKTDLFGKTSIDRLFAAGEVTSMGIHGANRLASNSLLDGLVFGYRVAAQLRGIQTIPETDLKKCQLNLDSYSSEDTVNISKALTLKQKIRNLMWCYVGIIRSEKSLLCALDSLQEFFWILQIKTLDPTIVEIKNMLILALLISTSSRAREESRGGHFRSDFPHKNDETYLKHMIWNKYQLNQTLEKIRINPAGRAKKR